MKRTTTPQSETRGLIEIIMGETQQVEVKEITTWEGIHQEALF
jgi:hypothetical protein